MTIVITICQYALVSNYYWLLVEGVYLHALITLAVFSESSSLKLYIILGWGKSKCNLPIIHWWILHTYCVQWHLCSYSVPYGDQGQNEKGQIQGIKRGIQKTGMLHKKLCVQSLLEDAYLRMCECHMLKYSVTAWHVLGTVYHLIQAYTACPKSNYFMVSCSSSMKQPNIDWQGMTKFGSPLT